MKYPVLVEILKTDESEDFCFDLIGSKLFAVSEEENGWVELIQANGENIYLPKESLKIIE